MDSIITVNSMTEEQFVAAFCGIYESSPWVAQRAARRRPFSDAGRLRDVFREVVNSASFEEQHALIVAHPDLGGKLAVQGKLTAESTREQSRLGLERLSAEEFAVFDQMNRDYQGRFGFPFIICVGLLDDKSDVQKAFVVRLKNEPAEERAEALRQIHLIAALRLSAKVEDVSVR